MRARGKARGGLLLGRFYFSKWLTFPVLGHKKVLVHIDSLSFIAHHTMHYAGSDVVYYHRNTANVFLQRDWNGTRINENWIQSVFYLKTWTIDANFCRRMSATITFCVPGAPCFLLGWINEGFCTQQPLIGPELTRDLEPGL